MGTTASGLPYPDGDDFLVDGDNAIKALSEATEDKMWSPGNSNKFRYFSGMFALGTDGRAWITVTGLTSVNGFIPACRGDQKWIARPYMNNGSSSNQILVEVIDMAGNTVNSVAVTLDIMAWGT